MHLNKSNNINSLQLKALCINLARTGGKFALKHYKEQVLVSTKKDKSFVTQVDLNIEDKLRSMVSIQFPEHNIFGEENEDLDQKSDYTWYIDPIDGTSNFIFGIPLFGTSVALRHDNKIILSAIYLPAINLLIYSQEKMGVFINNKKYEYKRNSELSSTTLVVDCGKSDKARSDYASFLTSNADKFRSIRQFGCVSSHAILLNKDNLNLSMIISAPSHDLFPLASIYQEAKFKLFNRYGEEWTTSSSDLIACKKEISNDVIKCLKATKW